MLQTIPWRAAHGARLLQGGKHGAVLDIFSARNAPFNKTILPENIIKDSSSVRGKPRPAGIETRPASPMPEPL